MEIQLYLYETLWNLSTYLFKSICKWKDLYETLLWIQTSLLDIALNSNISIVCLEMQRSLLYVALIQEYLLSVWKYNDQYEASLRISLYFVSGNTDNDHHDTFDHCKIRHSAERFEE